MQWEFLSAVGSGSLQWRVVVGGREWLSEVGSGCLGYGVVVCGTEW